MPQPLCSRWHTPVPPHDVLQIASLARKPAREAKATKQDWVRAMSAEGAPYSAVDQVRRLAVAQRAH